MTNFNPLNFIADHAGMNLADAIKEAYEQGKKDAQERKMGRWEHEHIDIAEEGKHRSFRFYRCSACQYVAAPALFVDKKWLNYCPNCGADMRGSEI